MKNLKTVVVLACAMLLAFVSTPIREVNAADNYQIMYRMYNPKTGEHLYTDNANEREVLYTSYGWDAEGIGWIAPQASNITSPIYRVYNPVTGEHHYTADEHEKTVLVTQYGWQDEGSPCLTVMSDASGNAPSGYVPVYRVFNPLGGAGAHHYTRDANEVSVLVQNYGWEDEGIAWYVLNVDTSGITLPELPERQQPPNIENTPSYATIEADVKLSGSGSGNHAKIVLQTPTAAVSFGIQYDQGASAPYTGRTAFLVENVAHNGPGGQTYTRYGFTNSNEWHHLMMAYQSNGTIDFYIDHQYVGSQQNVALTNTGTLVCAVEGAARLNGDSVDAQFNNIKIKGGGVYDPNRGFNNYPQKDRIAHGFNYDTSQFVWSTGNARISGTVCGLNGDWDSDYNSASGVIMFSDGL